MKNTNKNLQRFIAARLRRPLDKVKTMTPERILYDDIGEFMKAYAEENDIMTRPRRSLIGSMKGEKIQLATSLLKWFLGDGLEVTRVYQVIEYTPKPCFKPLGNVVSNARRTGDADPSKAINADTMKLVRNSSLIQVVLRVRNNHIEKLTTEVRFSFREGCEF